MDRDILLAVVAVINALSSGAALIMHAMAAMQRPRTSTISVNGPTELSEGSEKGDSHPTTHFDP